MLTNYDGQSITYDAIGNPTEYLGSALTWQNGRELATFTNSAYSISYSYDVNGLRTEKAVTQSGATTSYQYFYSGSTLLQERIGNNTIFNFIYTADGKPYALEYSANNGTSYTTYYYLTNLQGDVVSILNSSGNSVVSYSYDSWGQITQTTGTLANTLGKDNPLRYRSYVFDEETNLYYLQSRYYDPQVGRFINADGYASTGRGLLGTNCFVYCENSPFMGYDPSGETNWSGIWLGLGMIALGTFLVVATVSTGGAAAPLVASTINTVTTTLGIGTAATGAVTTFAASTDSTMVIDVSVVNTANEKVGFSTVIDFSTDSMLVDNYAHYGITTSGTSVSYGVGFVHNYEYAGDYAGSFVDGGASFTSNGIAYGIETCSSPSTSQSRCMASLFTVGFGVPYYPKQGITGYLGYDYYIPVS